MSKNKINWKYAIGEIVIVSVGIIIAFSINTMSSNWHLKFAFNEGKNSLISDLEQNIISLDRISKAQKTKVLRLDKLYYALDQPNLNLDSIGIILFEERKSPTFYPINGAFKSLISQEILEYFDPEVKKELFNLHDHSYQRTIYNGNLYDEAYVEIYDLEMIKLIDFRTKKILNKELLLSKEFRQSLAYVIDEATSYVQLVNKSKTDSEKLLALLKS